MEGLIRMQNLTKDKNLKFVAVCTECWGTLTGSVSLTRDGIYLIKVNPHNCQDTINTSRINE